MCDCYNNEIGFIKRKSVFKKEKPIISMFNLIRQREVFLKKLKEVKVIWLF